MRHLPQLASMNPITGCFDEFDVWTQIGFELALECASNPIHNKKRIEAVNSTNDLSRDIVQQVSSILIEEVRKSVFTSTESNIEQLKCISIKSSLTHSEAAMYLGISEDTLSQWVKDGRIPFMKFGGKNSFYSRHAIDEAVLIYSEQNPRKLTQREKIIQMLKSDMEKSN